MERTGFYCVLISLLVMVTLQSCSSQRPDLIIRYGKSYPARPRPMPKSPYYAKRADILLRGSSDFLPEFSRDNDPDLKEPIVDDDDFAETPYDMAPLSLWRSQRQRLTRPKFLRN